MTELKIEKQITTTETTSFRFELDGRSLKVTNLDTGLEQWVLNIKSDGSLRRVGWVDPELGLPMDGSKVALTD
jgi:hypothetical protein